MSSAVIEIEMPDDLARCRLPEGVQERLNMLLDKQDGEGSVLHMRQQNYPVVICKMSIFQTARTGAG